MWDHGLPTVSFRSALKSSQEKVARKQLENLVQSVGKTHKKLADHPERFLLLEKMLAKLSDMETLWKFVNPESSSGPQITFKQACTKIRKTPFEVQSDVKDGVLQKYYSLCDLA